MKSISKLIAVLMTFAMLIVCSVPVIAETIIIDVPIDISDLFDDPETDDNTTSNNDGDNASSTKDMTQGDSSQSQTKPEEDKKEETPVTTAKFNDVNNQDWFYSYVTELSTKGIIKGYPDGTFKPKGNITRAEFLKLLVECMGYEITNNQVFDDVTKNDKTDEWYYGYVSAAADHNVISVEAYGKELKPNEIIKRDEVAALLINALGVETGKYATPYVDTDDKNVVALYTTCLMQGTIDDKSGERYFFPLSNITRAEVSAVFTRLLEYNTDKEKFIKEKMAEYNMTELKLLSLPKTDEQFYKAVNKAGLAPAFSFVIDLDFEPTLYDAEVLRNNIYGGYLACYHSHPELFSHLYIDISEAQEIVESKSVKFSFPLMDPELYDFDLINRMNAECREKAKDIALAIYYDNYGKTELELAKAVHDYIVKSTVYRDSAQTFYQYLPYGSLILGEGVCQSYSAAFNMICKELGINSISVVNDDHMWNVIELRGNHYYFDCTWDDQEKNNIILDTYRGVSKSIIKATHGPFTIYEYALDTYRS